MVARCLWVVVSVCVMMMCLCVCIGAAFTDPLEPIKKELYYTEAQYADVELTAVNPRFQFGEELYISENIFCSSQNLPQKQLQCIPCNYSGAASGGQCVSSSLNVPSLPQITDQQRATLPNCPCSRRYCIGSILSLSKKTAFFFFLFLIGRRANNFEISSKARQDRTGSQGSTRPRET